MDLNYVTEFQNAMMDAGLGCHGDIVADGSLQRFHVDGDKSGSKNGWYCLFTDGVAAGAFGSWKLDFKMTWRANPTKRLSKPEREKLQLAIESETRQRKQELMAQQKETAVKAHHNWDNSPDAIFHPYLKRKKILPFGVRQNGEALIIPLYDINGKLWSIQSIFPDGSKYFMKGGRIKECFFSIGDIKDQVFIGEGFATMASLFMHHTNGKPVITAFNAKNLTPAATAVRKKYPDINITIAADNDIKTPGNPGILEGRKAMKSVGAELIYPKFDDLPYTGTDFNDYFNGGAS
jgi:putative DNA primase/helicase